MPVHAAALPSFLFLAKPSITLQKKKTPRLLEVSPARSVGTDSRSPPNVSQLQCYSRLSHANGTYFPPTAHLWFSRCSVWTKPLLVWTPHTTEPQTRCLRPQAWLRYLSITQNNFGRLESLLESLLGWKCKWSSLVVDAFPLVEYIIGTKKQRGEVCFNCCHTSRSLPLGVVFIFLFFLC